MEERPMDIFRFVNQKLLIDDLEPQYTAIVRAKLPLDIRFRLCFAEGLTDHIGWECDIAEQPDFWQAVSRFLAQPTRGAARRYFRGTPAKEAVKIMERRFPDIAEFFGGLPENYKEAERYIRELPTFGRFVAFKIADMAERTCGIDICFDGVGLKELSDLPRKGAEVAAFYLGVKPERLLEMMLRYRWKRLAPPHRDRPLNIQEIETAWCNYGHSNWRAPGYECENLRKGLKGFGRLAQKISGCIGKDVVHEKTAARN